MPYVLATLLNVIQFIRETMASRLLLYTNYHTLTFFFESGNIIREKAAAAKFQGKKKQNKKIKHVPTNGSCFSLSMLHSFVCFFCCCCCRQIKTKEEETEKVPSTTPKSDSMVETLENWERPNEKVRPAASQLF